MIQILELFGGIGSPRCALRNIGMALCGLPVKKVWEKVREFLAKYTDELPDTDELDGDSTTGNVEEHRTQER